MLGISAKKNRKYGRNNWIEIEYKIEKNQKKNEQKTGNVFQQYSFKKGITLWDRNSHPSLYVETTLAKEKTWIQHTAFPTRG